MRNSVINENCKGRNRGSKWLLLFLVVFFTFAACNHGEVPGEELQETEEVDYVEQAKEEAERILEEAKIE